uniref:Uncharacterized protein n=1 Tax=Sphaerodactylus townsendi TaxID=933632 RepID=A0ACB8EI97_9SAUR
MKTINVYATNSERKTKQNSFDATELYCVKIVATRLTRLSKEFSIPLLIEGLQRQLKEKPHMEKGIGRLLWKWRSTIVSGLKRAQISRTNAILIPNLRSGYLSEKYCEFGACQPTKYGLGKLSWKCQHPIKTVAIFCI